MIRYLLSLICFGSFVLVLLYGCASGGQLTGGPKDVSPPVLDTLKSAPIKPLYYFPQKLEFYFNEFVQVKDPNKQVLVSPPLTYIPKVQERGKKVTFEFDPKEILREDATYTINFGESIVDFTEGNKLSNFNYVFSTGGYIDSLSLKGRIVNAQTNKGDEEMVVFLYTDTQDSIVRKEKPFYFAKPNKEGFFEFNNIKNDTFLLFGLNDKNLNYKYDLDIEKIAFLDSLIILDTSFRTEIVLRSSLAVPQIKKISHDTKTFGQILIQYNTAVKDSVSLNFSENDITWTKDIKNDSLFIYYNTSLDSFNLLLSTDTLTIKPRNKSKFLKENPFKWIGQSHKNKIISGDSIMIHFNFPIASIDKDLISVTDTIGPLDKVNISLSNNKKSLIIKAPLISGELYTISIDSAALKNIYDQVNNYLELNLEALTKDKTSTLLVQVNELDAESNYLMKVMLGQTSIFESPIMQKDSVAFRIENLIPEQYDIEIFEDKNNNGVWDPGNYDTKTQPEFYTKVVGGKLRENKDTDMVVKWKTLISGNEPKAEVGGLITTPPGQNK